MAKKKKSPEDEAAASPVKTKDIPLKDRKMLWGRSGNVCAKCKSLLHEDKTLCDDESLVGEECHIVGEKPDGPRGNFPLALELRNRFDNLILLCNRCHKIVDDQVGTYTVEVLREMKRTHMASVEAAQDRISRERREGAEALAEIVERITDLSHFNDWTRWTFNFLKADFIHIQKSVLADLELLSRSLFGRVSPHGFDELVRAIDNYAAVLVDLLGETSKHLVSQNEQFYVSDKFYKDRFPNPLYDKQMKEYAQYVYLSRDLLLELTRAGNFFIEQVRLSLDGTFRLRGGWLVVEDGYFEGFKTRLYQPTYLPEERATLYRGLERFKTDRLTRDFCSSIHSQI